MSSGLPFLIVRSQAKDYGTANRIEGVYEAGQRVCLVEDVVTTGGAATPPAGRARPAWLAPASVVLSVVGLLVSIPVSSLAFVYAYRLLGGKAEPRPVDAALAA